MIRIDIRSKIIGECLILTPDARLDGYGSTLIERLFLEKITDQIRFVILDLDDVPYISSAGIRFFLNVRKIMIARSGNIILCHVHPFPENILKMAGMEKIFLTYTEMEQAIASCTNFESNISDSSSFHSSEYQTDEELIKVTSTGKGECRLQVTGSLTRILHSSIRPEDVYEIRFSDCEYSIGCGALAENKWQARQLLGEMITLHGSIVWLPTDGNSTPDYFIPVKDTGEIRIYSGFNAALHGQFHDSFTITSNTQGGTPISRIYKLIFDHARKKRENYSGIVALALTGNSGGVRSSAIIHPPIQEFAPPDGGSIMDPDNIKNWIEVKEDSNYNGDIIVAFGIGVDLKHDLSAFNPDDLSNLYYIHPSNRGLQEMSLHTHGVIFRDLPLKHYSDINHKIKHILVSGEFLDMRHLMDDTRIYNISGAVAYISGIDIINQPPFSETT